MSHRRVFCVFIEVDFENYKMLEIFVFLQKLVNLKHKTQQAAFSHVNISNMV